MMSRFNREQLVRNLPDAYSKGPESNNARILEIEHSALARLREEINGIYDSLDINNANGKTLDLYGEMVGQERGAATDEQYRVLIKNRIVRNRVDADYNSIVHALCITFGCEPTDIMLAESPDKCAVTLEGIPFDAINRFNMDTDTAIQIVNALIPVGVYFESINFNGTFEFSGPELVYDADKGFADEAQTIGGYLGLAPDTGKNDLPV